MQDLLHLTRAKEEVFAAVLGLQEAETVGVPLHLARDQVCAVGKDVGIAPVAHQLTVALHRLEAAGEELLLFLADLETDGELSPAHWYAFFGQHLQDVFAAGQRVFVLCELAFDERVGAANLFESLGALAGFAAFSGAVFAAASAWRRPWAWAGRRSLRRPCR